MPAATASRRGRRAIYPRPHPRIARRSSAPPAYRRGFAVPAETTRSAGCRRRMSAAPVPRPLVTSTDRRPDLQTAPVPSAASASYTITTDMTRRAPQCRSAGMAGTQGSRRAEVAGAPQCGPAGVAGTPQSRPARVAGAERAAFAAPSLFRSLCMGLTSPALRNTYARTSRPVWTIRPLSNTVLMPPAATIRHPPPQQRCGIRRPPTRTRRAAGATEVRPSAAGSPCRLPNRPTVRLAGPSGRLTSLSSLLPRRLRRFRPIRSLQHNYNGG